MEYIYRIHILGPRRETVCRVSYLCTMHDVRGIVYASSYCVSCTVAQGLTKGDDLVNCEVHKHSDPWATTYCAHIWIVYHVRTRYDVFMCTCILHCAFVSMYCARANPAECVRGVYE